MQTIVQDRWRLLLLGPLVVAKSMTTLVGGLLQMMMKGNENWHHCWLHVLICEMHID